VIELDRVSRRFGAVQALTNVSFAVAAGEIAGFLGENGAGKTTTLRILAGFLPADSGTARVAGIDVAADPLAVRQRLGVLPENAPLYAEMTVADYLGFRARLKNVPRGQRRARIDEVVAACELGEVQKRRAGALSRGYRQRVGLADALLGRPDVLLLDEPSAGLDPNQQRELRALLRRLAGRHTVLYSSHLIAEVEAVSDRVIVLVKGQVAAVDTPLAVCARLGVANLDAAFAALTAPPAASGGGGPP
jgi:ABC-2 type transport system ATP-binding protein